MFFRLGKNQNGFLPEPEELRAEFVLELSAVEDGVDGEAVERRVAMKEAVRGDHVEDLDGKSVGGRAQFGAREKQGLRVAGLEPEFEQRRGRRQGGTVEGMEEDEEVEVGVVSVELTAGGGAIQENRVELEAEGGAGSLEELFDLLFLIHGRLPVA